MWLDPQEVEIGWRARSDLGDINQLAASIAKNGQVQPIAVAKNGSGKFHVIAGVRRLTACRQLGVQVAAVRIHPSDEQHAVQMQLEENIARKDFDHLEVAEGLARLKSIYEEAHPETKHGASGGGVGGKGTRTKAQKSKDDKPAERFTLRAAKSLGCGETKVKEYLQMAELPRRSKAKIDRAKTTGERNKLVREALRSVRVERKKDKLKSRAEQIQAERQEVKEEGAPTVVLKLQDNREYFKAPDPGNNDTAVKFDLILTDPPYGQRKSIIGHAMRGDISSDFGKWDELDVGWVLQAAPLLEDSGQMLIFSPLEAIGELKLVCEACDLKWRGAMIWIKTNPGTAHRDVYVSALEAICWATRGDGYVFQPWVNAGAPEAQNVVTGPICGGDERLDHPNQKPLWLLERLLQRHTAAHSRVIDPFCGVGSTLVSAKKLGLYAVGVEKEAHYVHQARVRLAAA